MRKAYKDDITVLLVDENEKFVEDTSLILKRNGCYVRNCANGFEAIHVLEREKFLVVVVSQDMVGMSGEEVTLLMREIYSKVEVPILMLVDNQDEENLAQAKEFGINDFSMKSNINETIKKIKKLAKIHELVAEKLKNLRKRQLNQ